MFRVVAEFLEDAKRARDEEELCDILHPAIRNLGYEHFCAFSADVFEGRSDTTVCIERFPLDWIAYHTEQEYWRRDPLLRTSRNRVSPFLWDDPEVTHRFRDIERAYMAEAADAGIGGGLLVPIRVVGAPLGHFSVCGGNDKVDSGSFMKAYNLGVFFYDIVRRMAARRACDEEAPVRSLTARERDCLAWMAMGRQDWDISALLGISEAVVRLHIQRGMYKFGVPTRTQAVVQAIMTNQIVP